MLSLWYGVSVRVQIEEVQDESMYSPIKKGKN
jgi:hypothetical protein